jgi:two-component system, LytTR family, response regulator
MLEEIKVLIIEDEEMWSRNLSVTLNSFGYKVVGIADTFEKAVTLLGSVEFDIALLDINLNNKSSGLELGKMLNTYYKKPYLFITAGMGSGTLKDAINARPSAYLIKPVDPSSLIATINSAINNFNSHVSPPPNTDQTDNNSFFVKQGDKFKKLNWADIAYLRSEKNYTVFFNSKDGLEYYCRSSISKTLSFIVPLHLKSSFLQINRAAAVQKCYIEELSGYELKTPYKTFTVTDSFVNKLKNAMNVVV